MADVLKKETKLFCSKNRYVYTC